MKPSNGSTAFDAPRIQLDRAGGAHPGVEETAEVILSFEDNGLASAVFGLYDQNLAHLERRLAVAATANGNRVTMGGQFFPNGQGVAVDGGYTAGRDHQITEMMGLGEQ